MLICVIASIAATVMQYMCLYDLFCSCEPNHSTMYLVLSLVVQIVAPTFSVVKGILILACSSKDLGMPPRKPQSVVEPPQWQPPQPPAEPWENNPEA